MHPEWPSQSRVVVLPGAFDSSAQLRAAGFDAAVKARGLPLEIAFMDTEFRDVGDRSMLQRLGDGPLAEARSAGIALWLAGISLGGFIAIACAARFRADVAGLCLIAPYLGTRLTINDVVRGGGPRRWARDAAPSQDEEHVLWRFLGSSPARRCPIFLGFGRQDRFAESHRLLGAALSPDAGDAVEIVDGAHDWSAWGQIWGRFLDRWPSLGRDAASA